MMLTGDFTFSMELGYHVEIRLVKATSTAEATTLYFSLGSAGV
jgi:hypothetical protein